MWQGGLLFAVPRKPLLPFSPMNSRGILCADHKVNHLSAAVRRATEPILTKVVAGNQSGAVKNKGGTEFPMLVTPVFATCNRAAKVCGSIFGDLRKAYYSVLVELVLGTLLTERERQTVLSSLQCGELRKQVLETDIAAGHCLLAELKLPTDLLTTIRGWLRLPWFTVQGCPDYFVHNLGVKPGDPAADVFFACVSLLSRTAVNPPSRSWLGRNGRTAGRGHCARCNACSEPSDWRPSVHGRSVHPHV